MKTKLTGLGDILPRAQITRTFRDGVCTIRITCPDPSRRVEILLTPDDLAEMQGEFALTGATGHVDDDDEPLEPTPLESELEGVPGVMIPAHELGENGAG